MTTTHICNESAECAIEHDRLVDIAEDGYIVQGEAQIIARELLAARQTIAAMSEQPPVADVVAWNKPGEERTCDIRWRRHDVAPGPLYAAPQPAVVPDGYALVPVEPTESMVVAGFESEPNEFFSEPEEWKAYEEMSGCQQAAHRAKLCWAAMLND